MSPVHPARPWRARRRRLAALTAAGVLAPGVCSDSDAEPMGATPTGDTTDNPLPPAPEGFPERLGDPVALTSGGEGEAAWSVTLRESVAGLCILIEGAAEGQMAEGCGFEVPEPNAVSSFQFPRDDAAGYAVVAGQAAPTATTVRLELADGEVLRPELRDDPTGTSAERLRREGLAVELHLPHEGDDAPNGLAALPGVDLVVQRGLRPDALAGLAPLEAAGVRCCNPVAATAALADRVATCRRLAAAGLPVPATQPADTWPAARTLAEDCHVPISSTATSGTVVFGRAATSRARSTGGHGRCRR